MPLQSRRLSVAGRPLRSSVSLAAAALATALSLTPAASEAQSTASARFAPGRIIVMPRAGLSDDSLHQILTQHGGGKARRIGTSELRIVDLPSGSEQQMVDKLSRHPHVKFAELDKVIPPSLVTNDPYLGSQWHLAKIGADLAWDSASGAGVTIAVLDTGVDSTHPDLAPSIVPGWNVYDNNANTGDVYGHGTMVAGSAAASFGNGVGVAGVAGAAKIMPIRISDTTGSATYSAMAAGITWAADHGARVANISYVGAASAAVQSAGSYMKSKGGLVTTSAGNYGTDAGIAATTSLIPVSATDGNDGRTSWSSFGSFVAVTAPGAGIYTTSAGGGYASVNGTSFSSPITAGVVALIMSANPRLTSSQVEQALYSSALDIGTAGRDIYYGYGRVDAAKAVRTALTMVSTADTTAPTASIAQPLASSTVTGLVAVNVDAVDNVAVTKVELRANGILVAADTAAPFAFSWDSSKVANGMSSLVATAFDAAGNAAKSTTVSVNVANASTVTADTTPPVVSIVNPGDGGKVSGNVSISVRASDNVGTTGLKQTLYVNGKSVASGTGGSLSYSWNTRKESGATFTIQAVAVDAAGNSSTTSVSVSK